MFFPHSLGEVKAELLYDHPHGKDADRFAEEQRAENQPGDRIYRGKSDSRIGEAEHEQAEIDDELPLVLEPGQGRVILWVLFEHMFAFPGWVRQERDDEGQR